MQLQSIVIARSGATKQSTRERVDCFASLAMTLFFLLEINVDEVGAVVDRVASCVADHRADIFVSVLVRVGVMCNSIASSLR